MDTVKKFIFFCNNEDIQSLEDMYVNKILTQENVQAQDYYILYYAYENEKWKVCDWLISTYNISFENSFMHRNNYFFYKICQSGNVNACIKFTETFNITQNIVTANNNLIFRAVCINKKLAVRQWLVSQFNLTRDDIKKTDLLRYACEQKNFELITFLISIGLNEQDILDEFHLLEEYYGSEDVGTFEKYFRSVFGK
jgi:hypothetical protein